MLFAAFPWAEVTTLIVTVMGAFLGWLGKKGKDTKQEAKGQLDRIEQGIHENTLAIGELSSRVAVVEQAALPMNHPIDPNRNGAGPHENAT